MAAAVADPDPVLYYEHIALYRDPRIKQVLPTRRRRRRCRWARPRCGARAATSAIVSYGAYVHVALRVAETPGRGRRSRPPCSTCAAWPRSTARPLLAVARHCGKVLIVHEDSRTGGIGESLAAIIQEEAFEYLDAPVRVMGALDTPVPYSPPLEEAFLAGEARSRRRARLLIAY